MAEPAATPPTTPPLETVAIDVLLLLQVPLPVASVSVVVLPLHTVAVPLMAATVGAAVTVTAFMA